MAGPVEVARAAARLGILPVLVAACSTDYLGAGRTLPERVSWLRRSAWRHVKWIGMKLRVHGSVPRNGLIVANHISYTDILGLSAAVGCAFVAKMEVAGWPLFGTYAKMGATIFVNRERRGAVADAAGDMRGHLDAGVPVVLFPEGTSTDSRQVLPFRSSLLEPVVQLRCPVTPCGIRYTLADGDVPTEVAYWADDDLVFHMPNLLTKTGLTMDIHFGEPYAGPADRKAMARELRREVCALSGLPE